MAARRLTGRAAVVAALVALVAFHGRTPGADAVAPAGADAPAPTVVSLTFDDGLASQYDARALLAEHGLHATFFVNSGRIGHPNSMTLTELRDLQSDGNEIGGHTVSHARLTALAPDGQRSEICDDRQKLLAAGLDATDFAYPFGASDPSAESVAAECGYTSAREIGGLFAGTSCLACPRAETLPPRDLYATRAAPSVKPGTTLDDLMGYVTEAQANGGGWVQIVMHHLCDNCAANAMSTATLSDFLAWLSIQQQTGIKVLTVRQALESAQPAVPANLLRNASLESDDDADGVADCWSHVARGENTATTARTSDAHTGVHGEAIEMTSYVSGERKLVSTRDSGDCAPAAEPGAVHRVSAWYKATGPARFVAYYRTSAGRWVWWAQSARLQVVGGWSHATWTTPAVPDGATHVSVGLEMAGAGSLTIDDLGLFRTQDAPAPPAAPGAEAPAPPADPGAQPPAPPADPGAEVPAAPADPGAQAPAAPADPGAPTPPVGSAG
jgi:peptidoglycan/xylan/chitin deacetylase (PgdA/CDA1 family)